MVTIDGVSGLLEVVYEPDAPVDRADFDLVQLLSWARHVEGLSPQQADLLEELVLTAVSEEMAERRAHQEANILARRRGVSPSTTAATAALPWPGSGTPRSNTDSTEPTSPTR